jgi:anti-sigma factor ChrR (cupin superfamily)
MTVEHGPAEAADLACLYLAGAMTDQESRDFERHLTKGCKACNDELRELSPLVDQLLGAVTPVVVDPSVGVRLAARIIEDQPAARHSNPEDPSSMFLVRADQGQWRPADAPGIEVKTLFVDRELKRASVLVRMAPGAVYPIHSHIGAEECLVVQGDLVIGDVVLHAGDYQRTPPGFQQAEQTTRTGCLLLISSPFR